MARKPTKTEIREAARAAYEQCQREKQYAIIKIERDGQWGFVHIAVPQLVGYFVPWGGDLDGKNYSAEATAFERESAQHWAERAERDLNVKATVINIDERWENIRYSSDSRISMAQRYV